jgi:hypothetical protein
MKRWIFLLAPVLALLCVLPAEARCRRGHRFGHRLFHRMGSCGHTTHGCGPSMSTSGCVTTPGAAWGMVPNPPSPYAAPYTGGPRELIAMPPRAAK